jgi:hypothetical protein
MNEERGRYLLHGNSIAVMSTVRITASGCHAQVLTGVLGLMLAGMTCGADPTSTIVICPVDRAVPTALSAPRRGQGCGCREHRWRRIGPALRT